MPPVIALWLAGSMQIAIYTPPVVYVAATGSDIVGNGTAGNPWATIDHACAYLAATNHTAQARINIEAGTSYGTASTIGASCSGVQGQPLTIQADAINSAFLAGGKLLDTSTCSIFSGSVYRCIVHGGESFWTLYEAGVRLQIARTPNISINPTYPSSFEPMFKTTGRDYTTLDVTSTDFDPTSWVIGDVMVWASVGGNGIEADMQWYSGLNVATAIDPVSHSITVGDKFKYSAAGGSAGYILENDLQMVDQTGEWYFDRNDNHGAPGPAGDHYLYLIPTATPISGETIVYPTTTDVLTISGAHDVNLKNIAIEFSDHTNLYRYATWGTGAPGDFDPAVCVFGPNDCGMAFEAAQPTVRHAALHIVNSTRITVDSVHITESGMKGIYGEQGCTSVVIKNSLVEHSADDGIDFEGLWTGQGDVNNNNTVANNKINNSGEMVLHGAAIRLANSGHNLITHNTGTNGPRNFVYVTDLETPGQNDGYALFNTISYNSGNWFYQDSNDGGMYGVFGLGNEPPTTTLIGRTNYFLQNLCDHVTSDPRMSFSFYAVCMFTDNQTHWTTIGNFICTNATGGTCQRSNDSGNILEANGTIDHNVWSVTWGTSAGSGTDSVNIGVAAGNPY